MKRLLALVAGGLGLRALLRRRSRPAFSPSPADDLRAKLARSKTQETQEPQTTVQEQPPEPEPAQPETVEGRRADVHAKARRAIDDLGK
jgi:hypothetical protein